MNVLPIIEISLMTRYLMCFYIRCNFLDSALRLPSPCGDIMAIECVVFPQIKDDTTPMYADFMSMYLTPHLIKFWVVI